MSTFSDPDTAINAVAAAATRPDALRWPPVIGARAATGALTVVLTALVLAGVVSALEAWTPVAILTVGLITVNSLWVGLAAATALVALARPAPPRLPRTGIMPAAAPNLRCAVLYLTCGEQPGPLATRVDALWSDLRRSGLADVCDIFVLSDTPTGPSAMAERRALEPLLGRAGLNYRRRSLNLHRKPGNIADWLQHQGAGFDAMLVLDADSRMTATRIGGLLCRMARSPRLGLIQTGMRLLPGHTRFARLQRLSARLGGPVHLRGLAAWSGASGNYFGHNALIRVAAFRDCAQLPRLRGRPPFGGDILSHDFVEAAFLRRDGWQVEIDPDDRGSFEEAPTDSAEFRRRDRRWCQGNLQHARILGATGLHPVSRLHLLTGIQSYLAAPIWLALLAVFALGAAPFAGVLPLAAALVLLLVPKLCGLADWLARAPRRARPVLLRAAAAEIALSALLAPVTMLRQSVAVAAVLAGRDCGWKRPANLPTLSDGIPEAAIGLAFSGAAMLIGGGAAALLLLPVCGPLIAAPVLLRWFDAPTGSKVVP